MFTCEENEVSIEKLETETQLYRTDIQKEVPEKTLVMVHNDAVSKVSIAEKLSNFDEYYKQILLKWTNEQQHLKEKLVLKESEYFEKELHFVAGVDISFSIKKDDLVHACACVVVLSYPALEIVHKQSKIVHLTSIYIPEYLAFREVEPIKELIDEINAVNPCYSPQLIIVDGNGVLHPRCFGLACHLGVLLDIPTIGVAKKLFKVDGLEKDQDFRNKVKNLTCKGSTFDLIGHNGFIYGRAVRSSDNSSNPIFVSVGHQISLDTAVKIVLQCCKVRIPEPVRWADILSRKKILEEYSEHANGCQEYRELNERFLKISQFVS